MSVLGFDEYIYFTTYICMNHFLIWARICLAKWSSTSLSIVSVFLPYLLISRRFNCRSHLDILVISVRNAELLEVIVILKEFVGLLLILLLGRVLLLINDTLCQISLEINLFSIFAALWSQIFSCLLRNFVYKSPILLEPSIINSWWFVENYTKIITLKNLTLSK